MGLDSRGVEGRNHPSFNIIRFKGNSQTVFAIFFSTADVKESQLLKFHWIQNEIISVKKIGRGKREEKKRYDVI